MKREKKSFLFPIFFLFSKSNREREREKRVQLLYQSFFLVLVYMYICICICMCVIHHHNIVLVVAFEQKSEWRRKAWLWLMWIARGYHRWVDHMRFRNSNNNFFCTEEEKQRNARLVVILLMGLSKSNIAWIKIIVDIIVARMTSWLYLSCQPFAYYPTSHDKQLLFSSSLFSTYL